MCAPVFVAVACLLSWASLLIQPFDSAHILELYIILTELFFFFAPAAHVFIHSLGLTGLDPMQPVM